MIVPNFLTSKNQKQMNVDYVPDFGKTLQTEK